MTICRHKEMMGKDARSKGLSPSILVPKVENKSRSIGADCTSMGFSVTIGALNLPHVHILTVVSYCTTGMTEGSVFYLTQAKAN